MIILYDTPSVLAVLGKPGDDTIASVNQRLDDYHSHGTEASFVEWRETPDHEAYSLVVKLRPGTKHKNITLTPLDDAPHWRHQGTNHPTMWIGTTLYLTGVILLTE